MPRSRTAALLMILLGLLAPAPARAGEPADPLLKLVPPDAALAVVLEDVRGHVKTVSGSPLTQGLADLPAVRAWRGSPGSRAFRESLQKAAKALGEDPATVRDRLFGEAVVLALRVPPERRPDQARGLLLSRVSDPEMLDRLIAGFNAASLKSGELTRVVDRERNGTSYHVREFRAGGRESETYATLNDRVFAWSNAEDLVLGAIDRQRPTGGDGGLAGLPGFQQVRGRLPKGALAGVYVDPRYVERLIAAAPARTPDDTRFFTLVGRYLAALSYAGAALEWRDGLILHTEEVFDTRGLGPDLKLWAEKTRPPAPSLRSVPLTAVLMVTVDVHFWTVLDALDALVPERDRVKVENLRTLSRGLMLGLDPRDDVAPHLGPGLLAYVERDEGQGPGARVPFVAAVEHGTDEHGTRAAAAVVNALKTVLALHALDEKHGGGRLRLETRSVEGGEMTALKPSTPFAFGSQPGRLVVGTTPGAVARALAAPGDRRAVDRVERVRALYFPDAVSFALADLRAIHGLAAPRRTELARWLAGQSRRPEPDAARDLDQALALIGLFDAAFLTSKGEPGFSGVHRSLGLVRVRPAGAGK